ncbi:MAG: hypothetical protein A4E68_00292 [Syntrophaceae bacterium PtaB.Bin095]|nr:MAG: hypothetical protein A4E68_00292 [Syntrophaceae bacterium PtaB.Bin095]
MSAGSIALAILLSGFVCFGMPGILTVPPGVGIAQAQDDEADGQRPVLKPQLKMPVSSLTASAVKPEAPEAIVPALYGFKHPPAGLSQDGAFEGMGTNWLGWSVKQNLQERVVEIGTDGTTVTDIRERWTCLGQAQRDIRNARVVYSPIQELTIFEAIKISVNKTDVLKTLKPKVKKPFAKIEDVPGQGKVITLTNLQPGDVVEVQLKLRQRPLIPGHFFSTIVLAKSYPLERSIYQVTVPRKSPLFYRQTGNIPSPEISTDETERVYRWDIDTSTDRYDSPGGQKKEFGPQRIVISSTDRWDVIRAWFAERYLTFDKPVSYIASERLPAFITEDDNLSTILSFIQAIVEKIQPTSNKNRLGGLVPARPLDVWQSKKGDCKDVVALLCLLFQGSGVRAWPVLVSPANMPYELPNPYIFTHAILKLEIPEGEIFFDPLSKKVLTELDWKDHILELSSLSGSEEKGGKGK